MFVDLFLTHQQITAGAVKDKICIVIDALRATSTIVTALQNGCSEIIPAASVAEALELKNGRYPGYLLGGEQEGHCLENFDMGNSPREYCQDILQGRGLIFTTTNGTKTLHKLHPARAVVIYALLNAKTAGEWLARQKTDLVICCAGTRGEYSLEDFLTAGCLLTDLKKSKQFFSFSDLATTAACFYEYAAKSKEPGNIITALFKTSANGRRLLKAGLQADLEFCSRQDVFPLLPVYKNGAIKGAGSPDPAASTFTVSHI